MWFLYLGLLSSLELHLSIPHYLCMVMFFITFSLPIFQALFINIWIFIHEYHQSVFLLPTLVFDLILIGFLFRWLRDLSILYLFQISFHVFFWPLFLMYYDAFRKFHFIKFHHSIKSHIYHPYLTLHDFISSSIFYKRVCNTSNTFWC